MASGNLWLILSESISWEEFPTYATSILQFVAGSKVEVAESAEMRLWNVKILGQSMRLVYDDCPQMVTLESEDAAGDQVLRGIHDRFVQSLKCNGS